jgi:putative molybdopterin biosynthesis protein
VRQEQFLDVVSREEAESRFRAALNLAPLAAEEVPLAQAVGRVLADDVTSPRDVPPFDRALVDGFALQAASTFGAAEGRPVRLALLPGVITPGKAPEVEVRPGEAAAIATGGMLPRGADAVVMVEHSDLHEGRLLLLRPAVPGENIGFAGTDIGMGEAVLRAGEVLTPRETGVLAALGLATARVVRRPRVAILSTGDEILAPGSPSRPGCVFDSNGTVLAGAASECGCEPVPLGIVSDDDTSLDAALASALGCDAILLSGGTSKGVGDVSYRAVARLGPPGILVHGVALKPGKPLCLAVTIPPGRRPIPVAVLPGFPTSALFTFHEIVAPVLRRMAGLPEERPQSVRAVLPMRVRSERGRTEYLLVSLVEPTAPGPFTAYPMGKGSGSVTAFGRADGYIEIPREREYLEAGEEVSARLLAGGVKPADLVVIGSHCPGVDYLLGILSRRGVRCKTLWVGSMGGLEAARRGECDLAGAHLLDPGTDTYNSPFLDPTLELVPGYGRMQGMVHRRGDPRLEGRPPEEAVAQPGLTLVNRNRGSGTRALIDQLLRGSRPPGYLSEARSHNAVAAAVAQGRADWGVAIRNVAEAQGLAFRPLREERYDFFVPRSRLERPAVRAFVALLNDPAVREGLRALGMLP